MLFHSCAIKTMRSSLKLCKTVKLRTCRKSTSTAQVWFQSAPQHMTHVTRTTRLNQSPWTACAACKNAEQRTNRSKNKCHLLRSPAAPTKIWTLYVLHHWIQTTSETKEFRNVFHNINKKIRRWLITLKVARSLYPWFMTGAYTRPP